MKKRFIDTAADDSCYAYEMAGRLLRKFREDEDDQVSRAILAKAILERATVLESREIEENGAIP